MNVLDCTVRMNRSLLATRCCYFDACDLTEAEGNCNLETMQLFPLISGLHLFVPCGRVWARSSPLNLAAAQVSPAPWTRLLLRFVPIQLACVQFD